MTNKYNVGNFLINLKSINKKCIVNVSMKTQEKITLLHYIFITYNCFDDIKYMKY